MEILNKNQRARAIWRMVLLGLCLIFINASLLTSLPLEFYRKGKEKAEKSEYRLDKEGKKLNQKELQMKVLMDSVIHENKKLSLANTKIKEELKQYKEEDNGYWRKMFKQCKVELDLIR